MGVKVVNRVDGDLRKLTWTIVGEWVLTWLTWVDSDLRRRIGRSRVNGY